MKSFIENECSDEWLAFLNFYKTPRIFDTGEKLFRENDPVSGIFLIDDGKVKITISETIKQERIIRIASNGDIVGHRGFFSNWQYPVSAVALVPTNVSFVPTEVFNQIVKANSNLCFKLVTFFANELRKSEERNRIIPVSAQIASSLLENLSVFGFESENSTKLSYTLSRQELADFSRTTYETVIRELGKLRKAGIIQFEGKEILILKLEELRNLSQSS